MGIAECATSELPQNHLADHRILAWLGLEGTVKGHLAQLLCNGHLPLDHLFYK